MVIGSNWMGVGYRHRAWRWSGRTRHILPFRYKHRQGVPLNSRKPSAHSDLNDTGCWCVWNRYIYPAAYRPDWIMTAADFPRGSKDWSPTGIPPQSHAVPCRQTVVVALMGGSGGVHAGTRDVRRSHTHLAQVVAAGWGSGADGDQLEAIGGMCVELEE